MPGVAPDHRGQSNVAQEEPLEGAWSQDITTTRSEAAAPRGSFPAVTGDAPDQLLEVANRACHNSAAEITDFTCFDGEAFVIPEAASATGAVNIGFSEEDNQVNKIPNNSTNHEVRKRTEEYQALYSPHKTHEVSKVTEQHQAVQDASTASDVEYTKISQDPAQGPLENELKDGLEMPDIREVCFILDKGFQCNYNGTLTDTGQL